MKSIIILIFLTLQPLLAKDFALVIGIGKYQDSSVKELSYSGKDIQSYLRILSNLGVSKKSIKVLKNNQATKVNIINSLSFIAHHIKKSDRFFMFFSGHGTSLFDEKYGQKLQNAGLIESMENSGAILPYDFNPNKLSQTLIIGKKKLREHLNTIDKKEVKSLVVFDACFAEKSIRNQSKKWINRTPNILTDNRNYPYKNIVYIASSIIQSQSGKFSPILESCLYNNQNLNNLKGCINEKIGDSMQIPAILANPKKKTIFQ
jgi:hypothetical protein